MLRRTLCHNVNRAHGLQVAGRTRNDAQHLIGRHLPLQCLGKVSLPPASSRVRASSCFFNSISELGTLLMCALAFVPLERSLRPRVGLFAPLRDKVTSSAPVPSGQSSLSIVKSRVAEQRNELALLHRAPKIMEV